MERGENVCTPDAPHSAIIDDLAKAEFIREMRDRGMSLAEALRELARRIRLIQKGGKR
jgi:hypothetical protein